MQSTGSQVEGIRGSVTKCKWALSGKIVWERWRSGKRQEDGDFFGTYLYGTDFKSSLSGTDGITNTISTSRQTGIAITSGAGKHSQLSTLSVALIFNGKHSFYIVLSKPQ